MNASESNEKILAKLNVLLRKVILPRSDDQTVLTFGITCKKAPNLVTDIIRSRGIILRHEKTLESGLNQAVITLSNFNDESIDLTEKETLASGLLCTRRFRNINEEGGDVSFTYYTKQMSDETLKMITSFCKVQSSEDLVQIEIWCVLNLDEARTKRLVQIIKGAEELKIEGLLRRSILPMEGRIKDKTAHQMREIFGFATKDSEDKPGYVYNGDYYVDAYEEKENNKVIESMRHFFELMIPSLDENTYNCFASMNKSCAKLLNDVQCRSCFSPGNLKWKISISCSDGNRLEANKELVSFSGYIKNRIIDHPFGETMEINLKSTPSSVLSEIMVFCSKHGEPYVLNASLKKFDSEFVQRKKHRLVDLAHAAETLKIRPLLDLVASEIVSMINHKQVKEIRATFGLKYDFFDIYSTETDWWAKLESLAYHRTKTPRKFKELIHWQDVEDVKGFGPEPSPYHFYNADESEESEDSEFEDYDSVEEEDVEYAVDTDEKFWKNETSDESAAEIFVAESEMNASESNKKILAKLNNLLTKVILPRLEDQTVLTFGITCKKAPKLVTDIIMCRGIILRHEKQIRVKQADITLSNFKGSVLLSEKSTLASGLLCTWRCRNIYKKEGDASFTYDTKQMADKTLEMITKFFEVQSSEDPDEIERWFVVNLDEAPTKRLIEIIKGAEELKIEGLLGRLIKLMEGRIKGKTAHQMREIFGFATKDSEDKPGYVYTGNYYVDKYEEKEDNKVIKSMMHFFELMIPLLDEKTYSCFASMNKPCAKLLNDVQSRSFFSPGNLECKISISCCHGNLLEANKELVSFSGYIKNRIIDQPFEKKMEINLKSTHTSVLSEIMVFCSKHGEPYDLNASLNKFDSEFVQRNKHRLVDLAHAAETLKIRSLLDLVASEIVSMINHKQVKEIRATFGLKYDFFDDLCSKETDWWAKLEYLAFSRTKTPRKFKELIHWQDVEDVKGFGSEPSHYYSEEVKNADENEESEDYDSVEEEDVEYEESGESAAEKQHIDPEPSQEKVDVDKDLSDEEFGEDEESHKSAELIPSPPKSAVPAEKLQNGFFNFCEGFRTSHIKYLTDVWHGHDSKKLIADLNALDGKTGVELWKSLPTKVGIDAARMWFGLSKDQKATYLEEAQKKQLENQLSIMKVDKSAESVEDLMKAYKKILEEAAKAEQEMEEAAKDLRSAFSFFCEENDNLYPNKREYPPELMKDHAYLDWKNAELIKIDRAPYVERAKKRRVEYHEKAMAKKNLAGASGPSTSKEDLEMDAYIKNWDEAAKARERQIEEQMETYQKKLGNGEKEADEPEVFVESGLIRLPDKTIITQDGRNHDPPSGYTFFPRKFRKDYLEKFPDHSSERANQLSDDQWDKLSAVERANYLDMSQKEQNLDVKKSLENFRDLGFYD